MEFMDCPIGSLYNDGLTREFEALKNGVRRIAWEAIVNELSDAAQLVKELCEEHFQCESAEIIRFDSCVEGGSLSFLKLTSVKGDIRFAEYKFNEGIRQELLKSGLQKANYEDFKKSQGIRQTNILRFRAHKGFETTSVVPNELLPFYITVDTYIPF